MERASSSSWLSSSQRNFTVPRSGLVLEGSEASTVERKRRGAPGRGSGVVALGAPFAREADDFLLAQRARAVLEHLARAEVLPAESIIRPCARYLCASQR